MNQKDQNHFDMFVQVQRFFDNQPEKWNMIPALSRYKNGLDENIEAIRQKDAAATGTSKGVTASKDELRKTIALKAAVLAGALYAYASEQNDQGLIEEVDHAYHRLAKMPEQEFINTTARIVTLAEERLEALAEQGVTADQLTDISTSLDDYRELQGQPRTKRLNIGAIKGEVSTLVDETNNLLRDLIDKSMMRFRLRDAAFYESYQNARTIVDR